ncbi:MAG: EscR/YscR/HrcR family type III secretion system export apparatus protein [Bdellovibrionales bacterium]|nr:EscR/YscR/HrcR family type III secretion system export apparatus protein [Bdellovibrionales bacterium]
MDTHPLWFIGISLVLALLPLVVGVFSSYLKVSIVLGFFRSGLGAQQVPGPLVIMGLSIGITCAVMAPVFEQTLTAAETVPFEKITRHGPLQARDHLAPLIKPWKSFLEAHTGKRELEAFSRGRAEEESGSDEQTSPAWAVLLPSFIVSQLREAFTIGFLVLIPFLVIDIIVANVLVGLGMYMLSPVIISLPLKLLLFLLADGWLLLTGNLIASFGGHGV